MKTVSARSLQKRVRRALEDSQDEPVVVTRHGNPVAVVVGVDGKDWETVVVETSPELWKLVNDRRKDKTVSTKDLGK